MQFLALTQGIIPAGSLIPFAGSTVPAGWLECDGSAVSRTTYADLFAAVGTTWGAGNGTTTFNVPDFRRRTLVGAGGTGTGTLGSTLGSTGGAETHTLTTTEMPAHTHPSANAGTANNGGAAWLDNVPGTQTGTPGATVTGSAGGGGAHNNMQPSAVVKYLVKT